MASVTVMEYERVVRFVDGTFVDILGPGRHSYSRWRTKLDRVDVRARWLVVAGQEMLTADGITVTVSATARIQVTDPHAYLTAAQDAQQEVYIAVQRALRDAVAARELGEVMAQRGSLGETFREPVADAGAAVGIEVLEVAVRDVMFAADMRRALAETALAREKGRAQLERARGEAAALRSLANTARLLEEHPALLQLRTLQAAEKPGSTMVLAPPQR